MSGSSKRKITGENNTGLYQVQPTLSTTTVNEQQLGDWISHVLANQPPHVWLLSGPIGSGKTTLVQHLARLLGVLGDITSPTFALQKIHPLKRQPWGQLVHVDAYRIKNLAEAAALELNEYIADP